MQNRISATLQEADRQAALEAIQTIETKLAFLESLTPDERREMPKMGDKSVAFVRKSVEMAQTGADYLPGAFDIPGFKADLDLFDALLPIRQRVVRLQEKIEDTMTLLGSDLYVAALDHYAAAKRNGKAAGLDDLMTMLGKRFIRRTTPPAPPTP